MDAPIPSAGRLVRAEDQAVAGGAGEQLPLGDGQPGVAVVLGRGELEHRLCQAQGPAFAWPGRCQATTSWTRMAGQTAWASRRMVSSSPASMPAMKYWTPA